MPYSNFCAARAWLAPTLSLSLGLLPYAKVEAADPAPLPKQLNLGSMARTVRAPQDLPAAVSITNGSSSTQVTPGMLLTPAQAVAVQQVLNTGSQSIILGAQGNALGGNVILPASQPLSSLRVPQGVTVLGDFANSSMVMQGNLINAGTIYAYSSNPATSSANIFAQNINNNSTGLISSIIPAGMFTGVTSGNLSLSLVAMQSIINNGTITSSAGLNLIAPNQIANVTTGASPAVMAAVGDINLASSVLSNSGVLRSDFANINIATQLASTAMLSVVSAQNAWANSWQNHSNDLSINSTGGTVQALLGAINVLTPGAGPNNHTAITGGDWLSNDLNLNLSEGKAEVSANRISGLLNIEAGCAYAGAWTGDLLMGKINISDDPTFFSTGSLTIAAPIVANEAIAVLAGQDINVNANVSSNGFPITMVAGTKITAEKGLPSPVPAGKKISASGPSLTGGNIDLAVGIVVSSQGANGGNILMAAYALNGNGGTIDVSDGLVDHSSPVGKAGNVTFIAPGIVAPNKARLAGNGLGGGTSKITLIAAQPVGKLTADSKGNAGTLGAGTLASTGTFEAEINSSRADVTIKANTVIVANTTAINVSGFSGGKGGNVDIVATEKFTMENVSAINAQGGVAAGPGKPGGQGGSIKISAPEIHLNPSSTISVSGGSGGAGSNGANGTATAPKGLPGTSGGKGGNGGTLTLTGNKITMDPISNLVAFGGSGGAAGKGGDGSDAAVGGTGGNAGNGGAGGIGGTIKINNTSTQDLTLSQIFATGGGGGSMVTTGKGGESFSNTGANGGNGGIGGSGGAGGKLEIVSKGTIFLTNDIGAEGGGAVSGGGGGAGGQGQIGNGGQGGKAGAGGVGGVGGKITITGAEISLDDQNDNIIEILAGGGRGGNGGNGGAGGAGQKFGGLGGVGGNSNKGGAGGSITLQATSFLQGIHNVAGVDLQIDATGGFGGFFGDGGQGGTGATSGSAGGAGGNGGSGAKGGAIVISAPASSFTMDNTVTNSFVSARGGDGNQGGDGGNGSDSIGVSNAGNGGKGGAGGAAGAGGSLNITAGIISLAGTLDANGGDAGQGGDGGLAGDSAFAIGGKGGSGGNGGSAGNGGKVTLNPLNSLGINTNGEIEAMGGLGGDGGSSFIGGASGIGKVGNAGGQGGSGGSSGSGGAITINASTASVTLLANTELTVDGGTGRDGKNSSKGSNGTIGGAGGIGSNGGKGSAGGKIVINALTLATDLSSLISADGGNGGDAGNGGDTGTSSAPSGKGLVGSTPGKSGAGANGGTVTLNILQTLNALGGIRFTGGSGGAGADGGNGGDGSTGGGNGAAGSAGAAAGKGGNLSINLTGANATFFQFNGDVFGDGGLGGNGGFAGNGGKGGTGTGGSGGAGGKGGAAGSGGSIKTSTSLVHNYGAGNMDVNAGTGGDGGFGGAGGDGAKGGSGGNAGNPAAGGAGGTINLSAALGFQAAGANGLDLDALGNDSGGGNTGGTGGTGSPTPGKPGLGSAGATGGKGGSITITSGAGTATGNAGNGLIRASAGASSPGGSGGNAGTTNGDPALQGAKASPGGTGGAGGKITLSAKGNIDLQADMQVFGGDGGNGGTGGKGSISAGPTDGGPGGTGGNGGVGGAGGSITISTTGPVGNITFNLGEMNSTGGNGGAGGQGGTGGSAIFPGDTGGLGGTGGTGATGGKGGNLAIKSFTNGVIDCKSADIIANAGTSGTGGAGGKGGDNVVGTGGNGGVGGNGANGANGGNISILANPGPVNQGFAQILVDFGAKSAGGAGGGGGVGNVGGTPGAGGNSGSTDGTKGKLNITSYLDDEDAIDSNGALIPKYPKRKKQAYSDLREVAFIQAVLPLASSLADDSSNSESYLISADKRDLTATIGPVKVQIARGAVVLISKSENNDVSILCLHEHRAGDVELITNGRSVKLLSSEQASISITDPYNDSGRLRTAGGSPASKIAIRGSRIEKLDNEHTLHLSQFSIPSAIAHFQIDKQLRSAQKDKELAAILKNAAVIHTAFANKGPFKIPNQ